TRGSRTDRPPARCHTNPAGPAPPGGRPSTLPSRNVSWSKSSCGPRSARLRGDNIDVELEDTLGVLGQDHPVCRVRLALLIFPPHGLTLVEIPVLELTRVGRNGTGPRATDVGD